MFNHHNNQPMSAEQKAVIAAKLKRSDLRDKEMFDKINGVRIVLGYHFGYKARRSTSDRRHNKVLHIPYINTTRAYAFRVTSRTHHLISCRPSNVATVMTARGKRNLVILSYHDIPADQAERHDYKPVINFQDRSLSNYKSNFAWLYRHYVACKTVKK